MPIGFHFLVTQGKKKWYLLVCYVNDKIYFRSAENNSNVNTYQKLPTCFKLSDFYNMGHSKRGIALIFNHETFDDAENKKRDGTEKDQERLEKMLKHFQFEIRPYKDLKYGKMMNILRERKNNNYLYIKALK